MTHSYSDTQLKMIRDGLTEYRFSCGKAFSWKSISEAIEDKTGMVIPYKNLPKFVEGIPHPDPKKKAKGERRYSDHLDNNGIDHIVSFLVDEEYVTLTLELLNRGGEIVRWPMPLNDYLNRKKDIYVFNQDTLKGGYRSNILGCDYVLTVQESYYPDILSFTLSSQEKTNEYLGFIVMSSQEQILLIGKEVDTQEPLIYSFHAIDNQIRRDIPPRMLVLQEQTFPDDRFQLDDDASELIEQAKNEFLDSLHIYQRENNNVDFSKEEC